MYKRYQCIYILTITDKQVIKSDFLSAKQTDRNFTETNTHSVTFSNNRSLTAADNQIERIYTDFNWFKSRLNINNYSKLKTTYKFWRHCF